MAFEVWKADSGSQFNEGWLIQEWGGEYSLVKARMGTDGKIYKDWCHPSRNRKPIEKGIPWKIKLGDSREEAIELAKWIIAAMNGEVETESDEAPF